MSNEQSDDVSPPIQQAVTSLADIHAETLRNVAPSQLGIEWLTDSIGRPWFAYVVILFVGLWMTADVVLGRVAGRPFDAPFFPWLQVIIGIASLLMTVFILITENRQGQLADKRAQVTLQLVLVNEQKTAKIIEMIAQLRSDDPMVPSRKDREAEQMARGTDLRTAVDTLERAQADARNPKQ